MLDCRPKSQFDDCHVFGSIHLDEECWSTGEVTSVVDSFKEMKDCHFALIGFGPHSFDLQMSVNAHKTGPSKYWKRKQRLKNASGDAVQKTEGIFKKMAAAMTRGQSEGAKEGFVPRKSMDDDEGLDPEHMQVGASEEDIAVSRWVCMFLQHDFANISYVRGGIKAIVKTLSRAGREGGVGLAEGAEACLEGDKVGIVGGAEETLTKSAREFGNMIKKLGKDNHGGEERGEDEGGEVVEGEKGQQMRQARRSLEGVGKGWSNFVSNVKTKIERRSSKDKFEESGSLPPQLGNVDSAPMTPPKGSPNNSPSSSPKAPAGRGLARMFGLGGGGGGGSVNAVAKDDEATPSPRRASELSQISSSLNSPPTPPSNWVRKLSVGVNSALTSTAQNLAAHSENLARKGKAMVPRSPRGSGTSTNLTSTGLQTGSLVSKSNFVSDSGVVFPAIHPPGVASGTVLVGDGKIMFVEGSADAGMVSFCRDLAGLSRITTRMSADNVGSVLCVIFKSSGTEEGLEMEEEEAEFVVEGHKECVEAVKKEFKRVRGSKKKAKGEAAAAAATKE